MEVYTSLSVLPKVAVCTIFYLSTVFPHAWFGTTLNNWVFSEWTRVQYDKAVLYIVILLFLLALFLLANRISRIDIASLLHLSFSFLVASFIWKTGFVINIEAIHFIQYGILAILIHPITNNFMATHLWCLILGIVDEAYQYFYLAPDATFYFDMNDVITNIAGAGFGIFFWMTMKKHTSLSSNNHLLPAILSGFLAAILLFLFLFLDPNHPFSVLKKPIDVFWTPIHGSSDYFHIIGMVEGLLLVAAIMFIYHRLYKWTAFKMRSTESSKA